MTWMQPISFRFLAPQIADAIYGKYFNGKRKLGMLDPEFINHVNGTMVCLTCAILYINYAHIDLGCIRILRTSSLRQLEVEDPQCPPRPWFLF